MRSPAPNCSAWTRTELDLDLTASGDTFGSTTTIRFACREPGASTFLELKPTELHAVTPER